MPLQNMATRIKNDVYFLIIDPISININCNSSLQSIHMLESSKILNNTCYLNSTFFEFDKKIKTDYAIYFSTQKTGKRMSNDTLTLILFYFLLTFLFIYIIILNIIIYYYFKIKTRSNSLTYLETQV